MKEMKPGKILSSYYFRQAAYRVCLLKTLGILHAER